MEDIVFDTQKYLGYLPIDVEIDTRKVKFLSQLSTCKIVLFVCYTDWRVNVNCTLYWLNIIVLYSAPLIICVVQCLSCDRNKAHSMSVLLFH